MRSVRATLLIVSFCLGCSSSQPPEPTPARSDRAGGEAADAAFQSGSLMDGHIFFEFAIYYLPEPSKDPLEELDLLLQAESAIFHRTEKITGPEELPAVAARLETDPRSSYAPPSLEILPHSGRGLSREEAVALQSTANALILEFAYPKKYVLNGMRAAVRLAHSLATATGGLLWDEETREVFSPHVWEERRITDWTEEFPDVARHTIIHAYKQDEYIRAITLGMAKFGLPDVVINDFSWSLERNMGILINCFSQTLVEGASWPERGDFDLDIRRIKNAQVREPQVTTLKANATGIALLSHKEGNREQGDPNNRLVEITFDRGVGPDVHAKQEQIVGQTFGWEDAIVAVKQHDDELEEASRQARANLPALRKEFNRGMAPGEFVLVKVPFDTPDQGHELMWVEVVAWDGDKIKGLLQNEPVKIPTLHGGQTVEVSEAKVFDYIHKYADGTTEGNGTAKILEKRAGP